MLPSVKMDKLEDEVTYKQPLTDHSLGNYILDNYSMQVFACNNQEQNMQILPFAMGPIELI
jgi:hypothetical protein